MSANSLFGRFVVDFSQFLSFCRIHHQGVVLTTTGLICTGLYARNVSRCERRLLDTQNFLARESQSVTDESVKKLNQLMTDWSQDGEKKDQQLARLHGQNIQQTRSLDRIMSMLQTCRVEVPNLPSFSQVRRDRNSNSSSSSQNGSSNSNSSSPSTLQISTDFMDQQQQQQHQQLSTTPSEFTSSNSNSSGGGGVSAQMNSTSMEIAQQQQTQQQPQQTPSSSSEGDKK